MKQNKIKLDKTERGIEDYLLTTEVKKISKTEKNKLKDIADAYLQKSKRITLRMKASDLQKIKVKAIEKGMPYQSLIASVMHQYAHDKVQIDK